MKNVINTIIDEAPYISLICMLAICAGELMFALHKPFYAVSALMLILIIAPARFIPAALNDGAPECIKNEESAAEK